MIITEKTYITELKVKVVGKFSREEKLEILIVSHKKAPQTTWRASLGASLQLVGGKP